MGKKIGRKAITKDDAKGGKKVERKKIAVKKKRQDHQGSSSSSSPRRSKYVGVSWFKRDKKWGAEITIDGKKKTLGYYHDEKVAARMYDEQAALLGKPVNFPLHEGMEQAVKKAPKGSGRRYKTSAAKSSNEDDS